MNPPDTIRKLHALATHPATPEHERAQARKALDRLLKRWDMKEEDILDEATHIYTIFTNKSLNQLELHVMWEIIGDCKMAYVTRWENLGRGKTRIDVRWTLCQWADYRACYAWYYDMLIADLSAARRALKRQREIAKESIDLAKATLKAIPSAFVSKYKIGHEALEKSHSEDTFAETDTALTITPAPPQGKPRPLTKKDLLDIRARRQARSNLQEGDRWEKATGSMGSSIKHLEDGFALTAD